MKRGTTNSVAPDGWDIVRGDLSATMDAYDELPPTLRAALRDAVGPFDAKAVHTVWKAQGYAAAMRAIKLSDEALREQYERERAS